MLDKWVQAAAEAYGAEDVDFWLRYFRFEQESRRSAESVHWRAIKALADPDAFVACLHELQQQL